MEIAAPKDIVPAPKKRKYSILLLFLILLSVVILANIFIHDPDLSTPASLIRYGEKTENPKYLLEGYGQLYRSNPGNIDNAYNYWNAVFQEMGQSSGSSLQPLVQVDTSLFTPALTMMATGDSASDLTHYIDGLKRALSGQFTLALEDYNKVHNQQLKYLNNSRGYALLQIGAPRLAEKAFLAEIHNNGYLRGACSNLFALYFQEHNYQGIRQLLARKGAVKYVDPGQLSAYYFLIQDPIHYPIALVSNIASGMNIYGFIGALLILLTWLVYLRFIDLYDPERWVMLIAIALLGMITALFSFPLYHFTELELGYKQNGKFLHDLIYAVLNIGLIEELVKIVPLLLLLRFGKLIREPIDYLIYAGVSALGFAFAENLLYFRETNLNIIHTRAMLSVLMHMFFSMIIAYGLMYSKLHKHRNRLLRFFGYYLLAAFAHGFFDFWLFPEQAWANALPTLALTLLGFYLLGVFLNNALNQTALHAQARSAFSVANLSNYIIYCLAGIYLFEYLSLMADFGRLYANQCMVASVRAGIYLVAIISNRLSNIMIIPGYWQPLGRSLVRKGELNAWIGRRIRLQPRLGESVLHFILPVSGVVKKILVIEGRAEWILVKLEENMPVDRLYTQVEMKPGRADYIVLRAKLNEQDLRLNGDQDLYFMTISDTLDQPEEAVFSKEDLNFIDWVRALPLEPLEMQTGTDPAAGVL